MLKEFLLGLISFISGTTAAFSASIIVEGLKFEPGGILFALIVIFLTIGLFISQFFCLVIFTGLFPFVKKKIQNPINQEAEIFCQDPEKIEKLKKTIKIK